MGQMQRVIGLVLLSVVVSVSVAVFAFWLSSHRPGRQAAPEA